MARLCSVNFLSLATGFLNGNSFMELGNLLGLCYVGALDHVSTLRYYC